MKVYAIAGLVALVAGVIAGVFGNVVLCFVPALPFVATARFVETARLRSALIAAALGFASVLAYIILYAAFSGVEDRSANPFCDEFCASRAELWRVIVLVATIVAAVIALVSGLIAFVIASPAKRPQALA